MIISIKICLNEQSIIIWEHCSSTSYGTLAPIKTCATVVEGNMMQGIEAIETLAP
jgi:hypothetical protein